ncbi:MULTISPECIES: DUF1540 domain-containing protein [Bacillaceae]|jgi:hypothetical protein|uniref:DUF1540 domain-containing protein n=1 Tax=Ectobacillus funiculus TaxID=137993 RepID=A0ABV5WLS1_9BACI|nr:DUF1540 domain-containing protein [Ectobacillus funiculus]
MPEVRCSVSNCSFWGQGNFCQAQAIVVQPDGKAYTNLQDDGHFTAVLEGQTMESNVGQSEETCCQTFRSAY